MPDRPKRYERDISPEEMAREAAGRILSDSRLIRHGAQYRTTSGSDRAPWPVLMLTESQLLDVRRERAMKMLRATETDPLDPEARQALVRSIAARILRLEGRNPDEFADPEKTSLSFVLVGPVPDGTRFRFNKFTCTLDGTYSTSEHARQINPAYLPEYNYGMGLNWRFAETEVGQQNPRFPLHFYEQFQRGQRIPDASLLGLSAVLDVLEAQRPQAG